MRWDFQRVPGSTGHLARGRGDKEKGSGSWGGVQIIEARLGS